MDGAGAVIELRRISVATTKKPEAVDVVVVGLGANGGTAAKVLSEAGLKVIGFDRGPWRP
jgi:choline dehydrogenase-like flavoprotein